MTSPRQSQQSHAPNGEVPPQPTAQQQAQEAAIAALAASPLLRMLPDIYGPPLAAVITDAVRAALPRRLCAECLAGRLAWNTAHLPELDAAMNAAMAQHGIASPEDPRLGQVDVAAFLPPHLKPGAVPDGMPPLIDPVTTWQGTEVCPGHLGAARAQQGPGRLLGAAFQDVDAAARFARTGQLAGMPGQWALAGAPR